MMSDGITKVKISLVLRVVHIIYIMFNTSPKSSDFCISNNVW